MLKSAFENKKEEKEERRREGRKLASGDDSDNNDAVDSEHVNELSDLFSTIENEFADGSAIDFSVLLEGEHAFNVEEVSEIFSDLDDAQPVVTAQDVDDAAVVDEVAALFASLEELRHKEEEEEADTDSDAESTEGAPIVVDTIDVKDAENVDELSDLFSALEEKEEDGKPAVNQVDWIASLDVDDVSALYSELEALQQQSSEPVVVQDERAVMAPVDPRIFVPKFSIRMEGSGTATAALPLHRVPMCGAFLAGPPGLLAGPPVRQVSSMGVAQQHQEKRKAADPIISATRRICAAKRRRVNGRFVREQSSFVSITSLQPTP